MSAEQLVGNALVVLSAAIAITFVVVYHLRAYWWRTPDGRHVFSFMASLAAVLLLATIRIAFEAWWFVWLRIVVFATMPVVLGWRLQILLRYQHERRIANEGSRTGEEAELGDDDDMKQPGWWPNQQPVRDGVEPVDQDPGAYADVNREAD